MSKIGLAAALAVLAGPSLAQMPPPAPLLHSKFIDDCTPSLKADDLCRLPVVFEADEAERRLAGADLAYWIDGKTLNIAARAQADRAQLTGTIEEGMTPLSIRRPLWGAAYRLTALDRSIVELGLKGSAAIAVYRGPNAPPAPPSNAVLKGSLETVELNSAALGSVRKIGFYTPPGKAPAGGWPVAIAAPGSDIAPYAAIADALIERGEIRPVAIVGLDVGLDGDYLRGRDADAFQRHSMYFQREVLPLMGRRLTLSKRPADRMLLGIGPTADWALDLAARDPAMAGTVAAFSPPGLQEFPFRNKALHLRIASGFYDQPYLKGARSTCNLAGASGAPCTLSVTNTGHAPLIWQVEWARALKATFPKKR
jgi:enterochelin esterase-like enzyme